MKIGHSKTPREVELVLFIIVIIWGLNTPVMKIGLTLLSPMLYNSFRLLLAALLSGLVLYFSRQYRPMSLADLREIMVIGVSGFFFNQIFIMVGMPYTTAGNTALVMATLPVEVALINHLLRIERISRQMGLGIFASLAGVALIVLGSDKELSLAGPHLVGAGLVVIGQFCYAYYTVRFGELIGRYSIYQIMAVVLGISAGLFTLLALPDLLTVKFRDVESAAWYSILFSASLALAGANLVWIWVVGRLGSNKASLYPNLCPIFSIAFAWVYLGETFGVLQAAGAAVTFLGLYLTRNQPNRPAGGK